MTRAMGWLRSKGSIKLWVFFAEYRLFYRALLQKRAIIYRSYYPKPPHTDVRVQVLSLCMLLLLCMMIKVYHDDQLCMMMKVSYCMMINACVHLLSLRIIFAVFVRVHFLSMCMLLSLCLMNVCMGWLRLVGSLKIQVTFAKYSLFYKALSQKRPIILRSLLIVATPYPFAIIAHATCCH